MLKLMPPKLPSLEGEDPNRASTAENRHVIHCNNIGDIVAAAATKGLNGDETECLVAIYINATRAADDRTCDESD